MATPIEEQWIEIFTNTIVKVEERSGVPHDQWRIGGRTTKANPDGENVAFWQQEGLRQVEAYIEWLDRCGWSIATMPDGRPGIEWDAQVSFGGTPVQFVIDCVYSNGSDLIVVDYKTGNRTPAGVTQLGLYASAVEKVSGVRPKWGAFYMTRKGMIDDLTDLTPWGIDFYEYAFSAMNQQLQLGMFAPNVSDHCGYCSYRDYCIAVNGPKSAGYPLVKGTST